MSVEIVYSKMKTYHLSLLKNPSRQNKRRIDREFLKDCKMNRVTPKEVIDYARSRSQRTND